MPFAAGDRLGPYEILSSIGEGGMGEVWKARDTRLERIVAIKKLKNAATARFQQEARAIAALNHPHVCQIFDIGPDYIVLEFVEGELLRGPLPPDQAIPIALQIAGALEAAHRLGILHRDLKPANIMVTASGVKLLDFGLAKQVKDPGPSVTQTLDGSILGTAAYMSPEQAEGRPLDERSDMFSFGATLYEILSGRRAFAGESLATILSSVLRDEPLPLDAPPGFQEIVARCLAKNPRDRFSSMTEVREAIEHLALKPRERQPSIAVLPFTNMSRDPDDEYFSDGLAEEILNLLAKTPGLNVAARTSSFAFRGKDQDITRIAEALRVSAILEGSVRRAGSRLRVTAQLIDAAQGYHLWSERYDRELTDVFAVQDEIAEAIADALMLKLTPQRRRQPSIPAYEAFLKGHHYLLRTTPDGYARAKEYFQQAVALDPGYCAPHAELAHYYLLVGMQGMLPPREALSMVRAEAEHALRLDPHDPHALYAMCAVAAYHDYDWNSADRYFRSMLAAGPVDPEVHLRGVLYTLVPRGHFSEAIHHFETVIGQIPLHTALRSLFAFVLASAGQYERAITEARKALEIDDGLWMPYLSSSSALAALGRQSEARHAAEQAVRLAPWNKFALGTLAGTLVRDGEPDRAQALLAQLDPLPAFGYVMYHFQRGDVDAAVEAYAQAVERREPFAALFAPAAFLKPLHDHFRWPALARLMNLSA